jgi:methyl-accepting chemotaxis protein
MKVRSRLLLSFLACGLVPIVALTIINYRSGQSSNQELQTLAVDSFGDRAKQQLTAICHLKKQKIDDYFGQVRDQVITFSEDKMVVQVVQAFSDSVEEYSHEAGWENIKPHRDELRAHYKQFRTEYAKLNSGADANQEGILSQLTDTAAVLQYAYIQHNPHPLGSKQELVTAGNSTRYDRLHAEVHPVMKHYLERFGYYDIFLVSNTGDVVYSVFKEVDFGTNLLTGPFSDTNLAECFRSALNASEPDAYAFTDFKPYWPSYEAPAAFISSPIFDGSKQVGVLVFQFPLDRINSMMAIREGLGETGETYLVGSDLLPRSDSFHDPENRSVVQAGRHPNKGRMETESVQLALAGKTQVIDTRNYLDQIVLSAFAPVNCFGTQWALVAEVGRDEAFAAADQFVAASKATVSQALLWACIISVMAAVGIAFFAYFTVNALLKPIESTIATLKDIAEGEGDLTRRLDESRGDEFGDLAHWFNVFATRIHDLISIIAQNADVLTSSSSELSSTARHLSEGANHSKAQSATVSAAAEEMAINMRSMAESSSGMSQTIRSVADSIEEMNSTIREIARNAEKSAAVANEAAEIVDVSNSRISALGSAANEIGRVIEVIQDIAEQTNLLALNATIEAARAGEAGKGFAVVATEVKELAKQTASATDDIRARIEAIQVSTGEAVESIRAISDVISNVNEVSRTIASAVEEQSITTRQIADNIGNTAFAADSVARGVQETAGASAEITQNITRVDSVLQKTVAGADQSRAAGERLSELARQMNTLVHRFRFNGQGRNESLSA